MNNPQPSTGPACFGKHWDANAPQCKGGLDSANQAADGSYLHPRCDLYARCAAETVRNNLKKGAPVQPQPAIVQPFQSIVKGVVQGAQSALVKHATHVASPVVQHAQLPTAAQPYYGQPAPLMVHPAMAAVPYMAPMNYQASGMQMPAYLTVQEPIIEGQHWLTRLGFNIVRSMVKAACHTGANFVDHNTINQPVYYQPAPEPPEQG